MLSARGTRTIRLQRRKSGLDFSIKGGKEHGIGVVVSWIKEGGAGELKVGGAGVLCRKLICVLPLTPLQPKS